MISRERLAVHGQRNQGVVGPGLGQRYRPAGPDLVERFGHHLARSGGDPGRFKQVAQPHASPLGGADRTAPPLRALEPAPELFPEQHTAVTRTLNRPNHGNQRKVIPQIGVGVGDRFAYPSALDVKCPGRRIQVGVGLLILRPVGDVTTVVVWAFIESPTTRWGDFHGHWVR
jgi:hypothetical protein